MKAYVRKNSYHQTKYKYLVLLIGNIGVWPKNSKQSVNSCIIVNCMLDNFIYKKIQCAAPENIHTSPTEGMRISWGVGGGLQGQKFKEMCEALLEFPEEWRVLGKKIPSMGEVWIF